MSKQTASHINTNAAEMLSLSPAVPRRVPVGKHVYRKCSWCTRGYGDASRARVSEGATERFWGREGVVVDPVRAHENP